MKILLTFIISILFCGINLTAQGDYNISLVSNFNLGGTLAYNDIWGYVDEDDTEYAILGTQQGVAIISLLNPSSPELIENIPGVQSIWRDMKSYGNYVYCIADQGTQGLLVINMSDVSNGNVTWSFYKPSITINSQTSTLNKCHNLYIDENGILYLAGCTPIANGDVLMFDLNVDPEEPPFSGNAGTVYSHDCYARGDTLYTSQINAGDLSIIDVSDKENPVVLGSVETSLNFTHNAWLSDDGNYVFTTDEKANGKVDAYNIEDINNLQLVDVFSPRDVDGQNVIPHNVHVFNNYLVVSWYTSGCIVVDVTDPSNMIQVGAYDTWPGSNGGFDGAWGAYPFLPSGLILISDISEGLYVLQPDYKRAARMEGVVTNAVTGLAINDAKVRIFNTQINDVNTNFLGEYKSGTVVEGNFMVGITHPDYHEYSIMREFINGDTLIVNAQLEPLVLNVEFSHFSVSKKPEGVSLDWSTETEIENEYFSVQRSVNGRDFNEIARVSGGGNSIKPLNYFYADNSPVRGLNYYRIRSNSYSGDSKVSPIKQVNWFDDNAVKVFPTFFETEITIQTVISDYKIEIYSTAGQMLFEKMNLNETQTIEISNLPSGVYNLIVSSEFTRESFQLIKK